LAAAEAALAAGAAELGAGAELAPPQAASVSSTAADSPLSKAFIDRCLLGWMPAVYACHMLAACRSRSSNPKA
jgi:hypothetical protein